MVSAIWSKRTLISRIKREDGNPSSRKLTENGADLIFTSADDTLVK